MNTTYSRPRRFFVGSLPTLVLAGGSVIASTTVTLDRDLIDALSDRATVEISFVVDRAHDRPKPLRDDGDIHIAGWSDDIGLTTVAEMMNSRKEDEAVDRANELENRAEEVQIVGVWRFWPEHGGDHHFVQDEAAPPATTTNPDHIFEMHPLTFFDDIEVVDSIGHVPRYRYKDAEAAFHRYENTRFHLDCDDDSITLTMSMVGYNYTEFWIELNEDVVHEMDDGGRAFKAAIFDKHDRAARDRRAHDPHPGNGCVRRPCRS